MVIHAQLEKRMSQGLSSSADEILSSSPLRKRSFKNLSSRIDKTELFLQNDDEAERRERRRQSESFGNLKDRRVSLGGIADFTAAELVAHYASCIKLSTENKINTKNAFNLQLIDYMSAMLKKKDSSMNNFQVASCTLDASTKIYASRVDRVHMDVCKMAGGLGILPNRKKQAGGEDDGDEENEDNKSSSKQAKRAKKPKRCVSKNEEILNSTLEEDYRLDPLYMYMNSKFGDSQPGFINFMGQMNIRDYDSELIMFPTERYWQTMDSKPSECTSVVIPSIPDIHNKKICLAFRDVFLNGDDSLLDYNLPETQLDLDMDMDLNDEPGDHYENAGMDGFDSDEDANVSAEAPPVSCRAQQRSPLSNIVDIRQHLSVKSLEYSYFNLDKLSLWAGPSHWKINSSKVKTGTFAEKVASAASKNITEKRERKLLELKFDDLENVSQYYVRGKSLQISKRTMEKIWCVEKNTNPHDEHYDEKNLTRLFLRKCLMGNINQQNLVPSRNEEKDVAEYDYNNLNDSQDYCPDIVEDDHGDNEDTNYCSLRPADDIHSIEHADGHNSEHDDGGWKLVPPPQKVARVIIPYAMTEKKLNMKKLKEAIWKFLTDGKTNDKGSINCVNSLNNSSDFPASDDARMSGSVLFSHLYRRLLKELPKSITQDLSIHIAFTALLHLANEKVLFLKGNVDYSDILITQDK